MKILYLGQVRRKLIEFMQSLGDEILNTEERIDERSFMVNEAGFIVSYGYRHVLDRNVVKKFRDKAINLHISLLPWNRGADPNLWSFLEDTPKGITIHYIDEGIDTGKILAQRELFFESTETLRSSYGKLSIAMEALFIEAWPEIRSGKMQAWPQHTGGSLHRKKDRARFEHLLTQGWDTPVSRLIKLKLP